MRIIYTLSVLLCLLLFVSSCKKENAVPIDFSKITVADANCIYISDVDTTDWTYDDYWTAQEFSFLQFADSIPFGDSITGFIEVSAVCPNPNEGVFLMGINTERKAKMKLVCVDTRMQVLYYTSRLFTGGPIATAYDFRQFTSFHKNNNYRLYYGFYNSKDSLYYKGHGDFRIE